MPRVGSSGVGYQEEIKRICESSLIKTEKEKYK
jgi:hypothetical protein